MRPAPALDDAALLQRCRAADQRAWRLLVARYEDLVFVTALKTGLDRDAALDVFQQVWSELFRSLHRIENPQALPRWLMVTARRLAFREATVRRLWVDEAEDDLVDPRALPDEEVEQQERRARVHRALQQLGDPCARLLRMLFLKGAPASYREISRRTGLAIGSIGAARGRCLARMHRLLEGMP